MQDFDVDKRGLEIDNTSSIQLVASVSFDRSRKEYNFEKIDIESSRSQ